MNPVFQWVYGTPAQKTTASPTTSTGISSRIEQAFDAASDSTGTSFQYLLDTAQRESSLQTDAKASSSSASGLFQFVESTWLQTLKEEGPSLGLGQYSAEITKTANGHYQVADASERQKILALREDPEVSSLVAGAFTRRNAESLHDDIGRDATTGELYAAHFLGAKGASALIGAAGSDPTSSAAELFPQAARANPTIFYEGDRQRTVGEVYANLTSTHSESAAPVVLNAGHIVARLERTEEPVATRWDPALGYTDAETGGGASQRITQAESALSSLTPSKGDPTAGFTAAAPSNAFSTIYRSDGASTATTATTAASFWQGFSLAPNLFHAALADDTADLSHAASKAADTSAALRASQPGQILDRGFRANGPLDLASFLNDG